LKLFFVILNLFFVILNLFFVISNVERDLTEIDEVILRRIFA